MSSSVAYLGSECPLEVREHGALCAFTTNTKIPVLFNWDVLTRTGAWAWQTGHLPPCVDLVTHSKSWSCSVYLGVRQASVVIFSITQPAINIKTACAVFGRSSGQHKDKERLALLSPLALWDVFESKMVPAAAICSQDWRKHFSWTKWVFFWKCTFPFSVCEHSCLLQLDIRVCRVESALAWATLMPSSSFFSK